MPGVFDPEVYGEPVYTDALIDPEVFGEAPLADESGGVGSFTADAVIADTQTGSFTADATVAEVGTGTSAFTADAVIASAKTGSVTADAVIAATVAGAFTADATIQATDAGAFTADAFVLVPGIVAGSFTADAVIKKTMGGGVPLVFPGYQSVAAGFTNGGNSNVLTGPIDIGAGGAVRIWVTQAFSDGGNLGIFTLPNPTPGSGNSNNWGSASIGLHTFTATYRYVWVYSWGWVADKTGAGYVEYPFTFTADAVRRKERTGSFTADAEIIVGTRVAGSFTADATFEPGDLVEGSFAADAIIAKTMGSWLDVVVTGGSPSLWFRMRETSGNLLDSGTSQQYAGVSGTPTRGVTGAVDTGVTFSGTQYAATNTYVLALGNVLTLEAWVYPTADARITILGCNNASSVAQLEIGASQEVSAIVNGTYIATSVAGVVTLSAWNHIVYTRSGTGAGTHTIYVNGVSRSLTANSATNFANNTSVKLIGARTSTSQRFIGTIDEVLAYPRVLSASDVLAHYRQGGRSFTADASIVGERTGSFTADADILVGTRAYGSFTADASKSILGTGSFTANAILFEAVEGSFAADAIKSNADIIGGTFTTDAMVAVPRTGSFTANAAKSVVRTGSFKADSYITWRGGSFTANALIFLGTVSGGGGGQTGGTLPETTVSIVYDDINLGPVDITDDVDIATAEFTSMTNGATGTARLRVRDTGHTHTFTTGRSLTLTIDGRKFWGGYVMQARKTYPFEAMSTDPPGTTARYWDLSAFDYNFLFERRIIYSAGNPVTKVDWTYPAGTYDDTIINDIFDHYLPGIAGDGLTRSIDRVDIAVLDIRNVTSSTGAEVARTGFTWRQMMDAVTRATGGVYYIDPRKVFHYTDVDTSDNAYILTDTPSLPVDVGYQKFALNYNGTQLVNDFWLWGAALGVDEMTYAHVSDSASIAEHGMWQAGNFNGGLYRQTSVNLSASTMVNGTPQSKRGHKEDAVSFTCTVFHPVFFLGQKVRVVNDIYGYDDVLPIRVMRITFANPQQAIFELTLAHAIDDIWSTFEQRWPNMVKPPVPGGNPPPPPPPGPEEGGGCTDEVCGITDTFNRADVGVAEQVSWGTSDAGVGWVADFGQSGLDGSSGLITTNDWDAQQFLTYPEIPDIVDVTWKVKLSRVLSAGGGWGDYVSFFISDYAPGLGNTGKTYLTIQGDDQTIVLTPYAIPGTEDVAPWPVDLTEWFYVRMVRLASELTVNAWVWQDGDAQPVSPTVSCDFSSSVSGAYSNHSFTIELSTDVSPLNPYTLYVDSVDMVGLDRCSAIQFDDFNRTVASGWGVSTSGYPWVVSQNASKISVNGTQGRLNMDGGSFLFPELRVEATGAAGVDPWTKPNYTMEVRFRFDTSNLFSLRFGIGTAQFIVVGVSNSSADDSFLLARFAFASLPTTMWVNGAWYILKVEMVDYRPRAKVWQETLTEPDWQATASDQVPVPGKLDVRARSFSTPDQSLYIDYIEFDYTGKPCYVECVGSAGNAYVQDTFSRTVSPDGWGTSDSGHAWAVYDFSATPTSVIEVSGGTGYIRVPHPLTFDTGAADDSGAYLGGSAPTPYGSWGATWRMKVTYNNAMDGITPFFSFSYGTAGFALEVGSDPDPGAVDGLEMYVFGTAFYPYNYTNIAGFRLTQNVWYRVRWENEFGVDSRLKFWLESEDEPSSWTLTVTADTQHQNWNSDFEAYVEQGGSSYTDLGGDMQLWFDDLAIGDPCTPTGVSGGATGVPTSGYVCEDLPYTTGYSYQASNAYQAGSTEVWVNGLRVVRGSGGYIEFDPNAGTILFSTPRNSNDTVRMCYQANGATS